MIDCVIGLAANLFYNSPMEACILICRKNKDVSKRGQILFINAVNDATRKNAESYLEDKHITKIAKAYEEYSDITDFAKVVTIDEVGKNNFSLAIPLYVKQSITDPGNDNATVDEYFEEWKKSSSSMNAYLDELKKMI